MAIAKFVAETIAKELGSDIDEIVDLKNRQGKLNFLSAGSDASRGRETQMADTKLSPADYDLVVVGGPVWAGNPTPAVRTYLKKNNGLAGKKAALFLTQDSPNPSAVEKTQALIPNANFVDVVNISKALDNKEENTKKIIEWCSTLKS